MDAGTPLKQFTECVLQQHPDQAKRDQLFDEKAAKLSAFAHKAVATAKMVAVGTNSGNKKIAEALIAQSAQVCYS